MTKEQEENIKGVLNRHTMNVLFPYLIHELVLEIKQIMEGGDSKKTHHT